MTIKIRARDRYLLTEAYAAGYANASFVSSKDKLTLNVDSEEEANNWVDTVIADNIMFFASGIPYDIDIHDE